MNQLNTLSRGQIKSLFLITGISVFLGLCADYFFFEQSSAGIGFPVWVGFIVLGAQLIGRSFQKKVFAGAHAWFLIPLAFFAIMVAVRASEFLTALNVMTSIFLLLLLGRAVMFPHINTYKLVDYVKVVFFPLKGIPAFFTTISDMISLRGTMKEYTVLSQILRGCVIAIPLLILFILLFASADAVFQHALTDIFDVHVAENLVEHTVRILFVAAACIGLYSVVFRHRQDAHLPASQPKRLFGLIETSIVLSALNILFFIFILIQFAYLFGGEQQLAIQGLTYAEYARKGFFELIAVAMLSFVLLWNAEQYVHRHQSGHARGFQVLSSVLVFQVILIMVSAFKRLALYEDAFGFTTMRLYSHVFIIWLALVFAFFLYKIWVDHRDYVFSFRAFISLLVFLAVMNIGNPEAFIAKQNIQRYQETGKLDAYYLNRLSHDAIAQKVEAYTITNGDLKSLIGGALYHDSITVEKNPYRLKALPALNLSTVRAYRAHLKSGMQEWEPYTRRLIDRGGQNP